MEQAPISSLNNFRLALAVMNDAVVRLASDELLLTPYKLLTLLESDEAAIAPCSDRNLCDITGILAEEICGMVLPAMLDEGANYIEYSELRNAVLEQPFDLQLLQNKFSILQDSRYFNYLRRDLPKGYGFVAYPAHVFHSPRNFVQLFPGNTEKYWSYTYPLVYEIEGLKDHRYNKPIPGWVVFSYIRPHEMRHNRQLMRAKIADSIRVTEKLNTALTGLGGLTASLTEGGRYLVSQIAHRITTGHAYTIANITNLMLETVKAVQLPLEEAVIAVVGAAGSIGSGIAQLCANHKIKQLILVDERPLDEIIAKIQSRSDVTILRDVDVRAIRRANIVIVATSSFQRLFSPEDFRPGAIVIDDSQPKNADASILDKRSNLMFLEGGIVESPKGRTFKYYKAFGPKLRNFRWDHVNLPMAGPEEIPSCLAEVMIRTELGQDHPGLSLGRANPDIADHLNTAGGHLGYHCGRLQYLGQEVPPERIERIRNIYQDTP